MASAAELRATGTALYVVGFGDGVDALTLNRIAWESGTYVPGCDPAGDTPTTPNPCYLRADDTSSLEAALDAIARRMSEEVCDGNDNDCDGLVDEELARSCSTVCGEGLETCEAGAWIGCDAPAPAAVEACDGWFDDDCDGVIDEGCDCVDGDVRSCGVDVGACAAGIQYCDLGTWAACEGDVPPAPETCDGTDDDCDGTTDEDCECTDGETRPCGLSVGACTGGTQSCFAGSWTGCQGAVEPREESCDGVDDDCDGEIDEPGSVGEATRR